MALSRHKQFSEWYTGTSAVDVVKQVYDEAVQYFEQELAKSENDRTWIRRLHSIDDVVGVAEEARLRYSTSSSSSAKNAAQWSLAFSQRVMYYGRVLDALAQHHPEYVSLVWGTAKFVLQGVLNHAEIVAEFAKAMSEIADALPRVELNARLYPTEYMTGVVARVYAHIMLFMRQAFKWYGMNRLRRAISSVCHPMSLSYKDTVDQIRSLSDSVDAIGSAAAGAELRGITFSLQEHDVKLDALMIAVNKVLGVTSDTHTLNRSMSNKIDIQTFRICDIQLAHIIVTLKPKRLPNEVLHACNSLAKRRKLWSQPGHDSPSLLANLNKWSSMTNSALFVVRAGLRAESMTKDLAVNVVTLLRASSLKVIWFFSDRFSADSEFDLTHVLKSLVYQILVSNSDILQNNPEHINISKFQNLSEPELCDLLVFLLTRLSKCFIVVETEHLFRRSDDGGEWCRKLETTFQNIVDRVQAESGAVKVLLISYGSSSTTGDDTKAAYMTSSVRAKPLPLTTMKKKLAKSNADFARNMRRARL